MYEKCYTISIEKIEVYLVITHNKTETGV